MIVSAIPSALRPEFPDRPLRLTPDPYGARSNQDFLECRNACDGYEDGDAAVLASRSTTARTWWSCRMAHGPRKSARPASVGTT
jgi:hypothetical protein